jgi:hypothetical protein
LLKFWLIYHFDDFENSPELVKKLEQFLNVKMSAAAKAFASQLLRLAERKGKPAEDDGQVVVTDKFPKAIAPKVSCFSHIDYLEKQFRVFRLGSSRIREANVPY